WRRTPGAAPAPVRRTPEPRTAVPRPLARWSGAPGSGARRSSRSAAQWSFLTVTRQVQEPVKHQTANVSHHTLQHRLRGSVGEHGHTGGGLGDGELAVAGP